MRSFLKLFKYIYINIFLNYYWGLSLLKKQKVLDVIILKIHNLTLVNFDNNLSLSLSKLNVPAFFLKNLLKFNYFKYV